MNLAEFFESDEIRKLFSISSQKRIDAERLELKESVDTTKWTIRKLGEALGDDSCIAHIYDKVVKTVYGEGSFIEYILRKYKELCKEIINRMNLAGDNNNIGPNSYKNAFNILREMLNSNFQFNIEQQSGWVGKTLNALEGKDFYNQNIEKWFQGRNSLQIVQLLAPILIHKEDTEHTEKRLNPDQNISFLLFAIKIPNEPDFINGFCYSSSGYFDESEFTNNDEVDLSFQNTFDKDPAYQRYDELRKINQDLERVFKVRKTEGFKGKCSERKIIMEFLYQLWSKHPNINTATTFLYFFTKRQPCENECTPMLNDFLKLTKNIEFRRIFGEIIIEGPHWYEADPRKNRKDRCKDDNWMDSLRDYYTGIKKIEQN